MRAQHYQRVGGGAGRRLRWHMDGGASEQVAAPGAAKFNKISGTVADGARHTAQRSARRHSDAGE